MLVRKLNHSLYGDLKCNIVAVNSDPAEAIVRQFTSKTQTQYANVPLGYERSGNEIEVVQYRPLSNTGTRGASAIKTADYPVRQIVDRFVIVTEQSAPNLPE